MGFRSVVFFIDRGREAVSVLAYGRGLFFNLGEGFGYVRMLSFLEEIVVIVGCGYYDIECIFLSRFGKFVVFVFVLER